MKIKNVKSPKQPGWRYIKKIQKYENKGRRNSVVIASNTLYFVVDERYEKKCRKLLKKYENNLQRKRVGVLVFLTTGTLATAAVAWLLTHQKPNLQTSSISFLEEQDNTVDNIEDNNYSYKEKEIIKCEIIDEILEARNQQKAEVLNKYLNTIFYDSQIKKYCGYFHFDYDKVIELARNTTNNYENFSCFLTEEGCDLNNPEVICMQFVYFLYKDLNKGKNEKAKLPINWEELEFTKEDIVLTDEITVSDYDDLNAFYLHGDLKYSELMEKYCDMFKINDKTFALSVSIEEIGKDGSRLAREQNNFGGMRNKDGNWMSFPTPEAGLICYCGMYANSYNGYTIENAVEMAKIYVGKNSTEKERTDWAKKVQGFYNEIQDNYDFYFLNNPKPDYEKEIQDNIPQLIRTRGKAI